MFDESPEVLPNFFLVGAMKAGTTSLANLLACHPDVYLPPIKEPNFFCRDVNAAVNPDGRRNSFDAVDVKALLRSPSQRTQIAVVRDPSDYLLLYRDAAGFPARGDCSTAYLYSRHAAEDIAAVCPRAKIVIMLRNPVTRALSEFHMRSAVGSAPPTLRLAVERELREIETGVAPYHGAGMYLRAGLYHDQIKRYYSAFGRDNIKVIIFERFIRAQKRHLDDLCSFLSIPPFEGNEQERANRARLPRSTLLNRLLYWYGGKYLVKKLGPFIPPRAKKMLFDLWFREARGEGADELEWLRGFFTDDMVKTEQLLGESLAEWHAPAT